MSNPYSSKTLLKGAMILSLAAIITKVLSAVYRVPFQNIVGDIGFYIYQQVYPFYGMILALATYGFPVVISKLVAEKIDDGNREGAIHIAIRSFYFLCIFGILGFVLLIMCARPIALVMGDEQLTGLIRVIACTLLFFPFLSSIRGYYQGNSNMKPTAISQVVEQATRVMTILIVPYVLISRGYSLYIAGEGALFGSIIGGVFGSLVLLTYVFRRKKQKIDIKLDLRIHKQDLKLWGYLLKLGTAMCMSGMLLVLLQLMDALNVYNLLTESGISDDHAKKLKGVYDRGQPFVQLGTVVATSLSLAIVPLVTSTYKRKKLEDMHHFIQIALKVSIIVGFGATVGIANIMIPTNTMLFENDLGSDVIAVFCISIVLSSVIMTCTSILHGMDIHYYAALSILSGMVVKYLLNTITVPIWGTMGASIATILSLGFILLFIYLRIKRQLRDSLIKGRFYILLICSGVLMTVTLQLLLLPYDWLVIQSHSPRLIAFIFSIVSVVIGGCVYGITILWSGLLSDKELALLPFSSKLLYFSDKLKR